MLQAPTTLARRTRCETKPTTPGYESRRLCGRGGARWHHTLRQYLKRSLEYAGERCSRLGEQAREEKLQRVDRKSQGERPFGFSEARRPAATHSFNSRLAVRSAGPVMRPASPRSNPPRTSTMRSRAPPTRRRSLLPCRRSSLAAGRGDRARCERASPWTCLADLRSS